MATRECSREAQTRPIGVPTFEDKVLQRAVAMVLEAIYEQSFHDFSYGFRPGRSAHQACEVLQNTAVKMAGAIGAGAGTRRASRAAASAE